MREIGPLICAISVAFVQKRSEADNTRPTPAKTVASETVIFSDWIPKLSFLGLPAPALPRGVVAGGPGPRNVCIRHQPAAIISGRRC
jgi:hypothetical protein